MIVCKISYNGVDHLVLSLFTYIGYNKINAEMCSARLYSADHSIYSKNMPIKWQCCADGEKMRYILSKMSIWGCILSIIGVVITIQGIIVRYNLANIEESYNKSEIRNGRYIACDISKGRLLGAYYTELNGVIKYSPYCGSDVYTSMETYIVSIDGDANYYVPLQVAKEYQKEFKKIINSDDKYHIFGKFERFKGILSYEIIAKCLGTDNKSKIDQIISDDHQIRVVDLQDERNILYKGLSVLIIGVFIFVVTVERKKSS